MFQAPSVQRSGRIAISKSEAQSAPSAGARAGFARVRPRSGVGRFTLTASFLALAQFHAVPVSAQQATETKEDALAAGFVEPPQPARPHVWWHWMSGNVTAEGARRDLDWLRRMGIGGVHAFAGGALEKTYVERPMPFMSPEWIAVYSDAVRGARSSGMDFAIAGSPGWSLTGGPWVRPDRAMKKYGWSSLDVTGGRALVVPLPTPPGGTGPFPSPVRPGQDEKVTATGFGPVIAFRSLQDDAPIDGSWSAGERTGRLLGLSGGSEPLTLPLGAEGRTTLTVRFDAPTAPRSITLGAAKLPAFEVFADTTNGSRSVLVVPQSGAEKPAAEQTFSLPEARTRALRFVFARPVPWRELPDLPAFLVPKPASDVVIASLRIRSTPRIDRFEAKAGFQSVVDAGPPGPSTAGIAPSTVIDVSSKVDASGNLRWTPPPGRWTVLRFGWSLTGQTNGPAEAAATGLEVDKLDPVAVHAYMADLLSLYRDKAGNRLGSGGIDALVTDSWEAGVQNWTPTILADFRRLRGYDPTPWLPTLAGLIVKDAARSDAFLFDWRRTLRDLLVSAHYETIAAAARASGMTYYTEAQGDTPRAIGDGLSIKARSDVPTGEFWYRPFATSPGQPSLVADLREAASAAHVYGKPIVAAEAMTVAAGKDPWAFSPAMLKPVADEIFANGVNRMLIHETHLQPFPDRKPGLMLGIFGQFFNRNDTWADMARPWVDYLARTSWMLQQGRYVADVAYFYGEEQNLTQRFERKPQLDVPAGFGFDYVGAEALLKHLTVRDGRLVSSGGTTYRVLFVPSFVDRMSLPVLRRLDELARAGAVIVAAPPKGGLGLADGADLVTAGVARLWGEGTGVRRVGKGRIYAAGTLAQALAAEGIAPDVETPDGGEIMSLHRRLDGAEVYYVSNRNSSPLTKPLAFRVAGLAPEWWSAEDGSRKPLSYEIRDDRTLVSLPLEAHGAGFVVFRGRAAARSRAIPAARVVSTSMVAGPWSVSFEAGRGAPAEVRMDQLADWSTSDDPGVRYFSGRATYRARVRFGPQSFRPGTRTFVDLGDVRELANVKLNGRLVATAWHAPYRVEVTGGLLPGENVLEVEVANLWVNRLIGDKQPGATPIAYAPQSPYRADGALRPSGLLGPVTLSVEETR